MIRRRETPGSPDSGEPGALGRHLLRSTASNVAGQVVLLGVWFALTPFIVHELGAAPYGLWVLVASVVAYGNLLDLGVGAAVTKYVADLLARERPDEASAVIATALAMYCVLGVFVIAATVPFAVAFPDLFSIPPGQRDDARWVVLLTGGALAFQLPATTALAVVRGLHRFDLLNVISVGATLVQAGATVVVLLLGGGVVGLAAINLPLAVLTQIPMVLVIRRTAPSLRFGLRGARRGLVREVASFSASLAVSNGAGIVKFKTDEIVIASSLPLATVAPYALARRLSEIPTLLAYQFVRIIFPLASGLHATGDAARLRALYVGSTRVALALFVPIALGLVVLVEPFLTAWVGARYASEASIAVILIAAGLLDMAMWPAASMLMGSNKHRLLAVFSGGSALLNLGLSVTLVGHLGVTGVALGTLIATGLEALIVVPYAMWRHDVRVSSLIREALAPALLPALPAAVTFVALRGAVHPSSLLAITAVGAVGGLAYAAGYLAFPASADERRMVWRGIRAVDVRVSARR